MFSSKLIDLLTEKCTTVGCIFSLPMKFYKRQKHQTIT